MILRALLVGLGIGCAAVSAYTGWHAFFAHEPSHWVLEEVLRTDGRTRVYCTVSAIGKRSVVFGRVMRTIDAYRAPLLAYQVGSARRVTLTADARGVLASVAKIRGGGTGSLARLGDGGGLCGLLDGPQFDLGAWIDTRLVFGTTTAFNLIVAGFMIRARWRRTSRAASAHLAASIAGGVPAVGGDAVLQWLAALPSIGLRRLERDRTEEEAAESLVVRGRGSYCADLAVRYASAAVATRAGAPTVYRVRRGSRLPGVELALRFPVRRFVTTTMRALFERRGTDVYIELRQSSGPPGILKMAAGMLYLINFGAMVLFIAPYMVRSPIAFDFIALMAVLLPSCALQVLVFSLCQIRVRNLSTFNGARLFSVSLLTNVLREAGVSELDIQRG